MVEEGEGQSLHPTLIFFGQETEAEGGLGEKKEEEKEKEKAELGVYTGEKAPKSPGTRTPLPWRGKAKREGSMEVQPELHPLQNRSGSLAVWSWTTP